MPAKRAASPEKASPSKKAKASPQKKQVVYHMNVNDALDKKMEVASLKEVMKMPVSALQGIGAEKEGHLNELGIKTVKDMGTYKYWKMAKAIATLAATEEKGFRHEKARMNINNAVDKKFETMTLHAINAAPASALQGLGPKAEKSLQALHITTVARLAEYKFFEMAAALVELSAFEE